MRTRTIIITIIAALLLFSAASNAVNAKGPGSQINELAHIDSFHRPEINDPRNPMYNEWHYFNVIDEEQNLSFMTTLKLSGDVYDPNPLNSSATVVLSYSTPGGKNMTVDLYPINMIEVEFSNETPNLRINSSTITLTGEGYHVHVESADSQTVFDAMFKPFTEPSPLFTALPSEPGRVINWLVASPKMKVDGTLTINKGTEQEEILYTLENVRGYHDHNWGYWLWQDDIGWDWGQASESKNHLDGNDVGKYAFCFGNVTNNEHTESRGAVLNIWKNKNIIARFENQTIQIQHSEMTNITGLENNLFPMCTVLNADDGENNMSIIFSTEDVSPLPIPIGTNKFLVIWELTGTYEVNGCIDGKPVSYTSKGFMEYVA